MFNDLPEGQTWDQDKQDAYIKANRLRWIEALESKKYKQTSYYLQQKGGFCCLGVACDLYDPTGWDGEGSVGQINYKDLSSSPPDTVTEFFGILGTHPVGDESYDLIDKLINMNDTEGKTFEEIAEYLRDIWELPK